MKGSAKARLFSWWGRLAPALYCASLLFIAMPFAAASGPVHSVGGAGDGNWLLMVTSSSCPWCEAFEAEVGAGYPATEEAKILPLQRHDIFQKFPAEFADLVPATMTPTFIIIRDGIEKGRIVGYPGAELFWWRLSEFTAGPTSAGKAE